MGLNVEYDKRLSYQDCYEILINTRSDVLSLAMDIWRSHTGIYDDTNLNFIIYVDPDFTIRWIADPGNAVPEPVYNGRSLLVLQFKPDYIYDWVFASLSDHRAKPDPDYIDDLTEEYINEYQEDRELQFEAQLDLLKDELLDNIFP